MSAVEAFQNEPGGFKVGREVVSFQSPKKCTALESPLLRHQEGILNYCHVKVPFGVVEAVNGNIKSLLRRGRGYKNLRYLLLKAQRMAVLKTEFVVFAQAA